LSLCAAFFLYAPRYFDLFIGLGRTAVL
jgi:hypothetical protein